MMNEFVRESSGEFQIDHLDEASWRWLTDRMTYLQGDLNDSETYRRLGEHLAELDARRARRAIICSISRLLIVSSARSSLASEPRPLSARRKAIGAGS